MLGQDSFLALTDTGSLRPVHITVGVRFFRVGQHMARVPLSSGVFIQAAPYVLLPRLFLSVSRA